MMGVKKTKGTYLFEWCFQNQPFMLGKLPSDWLFLLDLPSTSF